jgi:ribose 5-phosphate isomerase B
MKIVLGADHNGVVFKKKLVEHLTGKNHEVIDKGPHDIISVDYPHYAFAVAEMVTAGEADIGILICGSGNGMSMAANKVRGIRAALCLSVDAARLARNHNDANILVLTGWHSEADEVFDIVDTFLESKFEGGRHARRVGQITAYEKSHES